MSQGRGNLTAYEVAYLAGGPARVAETVTVELLRRRQLRVLPTGVLAPVPAGAPARLPDSADAAASAGGPADAGIERRIADLAAQAGGLSLRSLRRRCAFWPPVRQLSSRLAAAGLTLPRRQRQLALVAALVLLAAGAAAAAAIIAGSQVAPTARSPLAAAAGVVVALLLLRAFTRTTSDGRRELGDTAQLTRQMLARLAPVATAGAADEPALTPEDVANVALSGLTAVRSAELRARLDKSAGRLAD